MEFFKRVARAVQSIPRGHVTTYGRIAAQCGRPRGAREVGWALATMNEQDVPWHRVVNASGYITIRHREFPAETQKDLLEREGIAATWNQERHMYHINLKKYLWELTS